MSRTANVPSQPYYGAIAWSRGVIAAVWVTANSLGILLCIAAFLYGIVTYWQAHGLSGPNKGEALATFCGFAVFTFLLLDLVACIFCLLTESWFGEVSNSRQRYLEVLCDENPGLRGYRKDVVALGRRFTKSEERRLCAWVDRRSYQ